MGSYQTVASSRTMNSRQLRRFWKNVCVERASDGWVICLDHRTAETPAGRPLCLTSHELATAIAAEWTAQRREVSPVSMPLTRIANATIDQVIAKHEQVADFLIDYADTDLVCYRALEPVELVERQAREWDTVLRWASDDFGVEFKLRYGVIHKPQATKTLDVLGQKVRDLEPFHLAAFYELVTLTGSLVLGLATIKKWRLASEIWQLSRLDEQWQQEQWGVDKEEQAASENKRHAFLKAYEFYELV